MKLAVHCQNGSHGKFGDGSGRVTWNTQNRDAESSCGIKIYVVKTRAAQKNKFDTERSQCLGNLFSYIVIYKIQTASKPLARITVSGISEDSIK